MFFRNWDQDQPKNRRNEVLLAGARVPYMYGAAEGGELISIMHKGMVRGSIFE